MPAKKKKRSAGRRKLPSPELIEALRFAAKSYFIKDRSHITLTQLADLPPFRGIQLRTLRQWSEEDDWTGARQEELAAWRRLIAGHASGELMRLRQKQLEDLAFVQDQAMEMMEDDMLQAKSWDSVAQVALKAGALQMEMASRMVGDVADGATSAPPPPVVEGEGDTFEGLSMAPAPLPALNKMTQQEAMVAAHAVLRKRREDTLETMKQKAEAATPATPPPAEPTEEVQDDGADHTERG